MSTEQAEHSIVPGYCMDKRFSMQDHIVYFYTIVRKSVNCITTHGDMCDCKENDKRVIPACTLRRSFAVDSTSPFERYGRQAGVERNVKTGEWLAICVISRKMINN